MRAPRRVARSHDSSTRNAAPSPSTSPERLKENGRQEALGSALSIAAKVRIASQARSTPRVKGASAPPAIITSASPRRILSAASPTATAAEEQAVEYVRFGPESPYSRPIHAAGALTMAAITVNGLIRSERCAYKV